MANESRFRPLDDLPLGAAEAGKLHADLRLKPTVDFLTDSLDDWLKRDASETAETPHEAPRIGLFGGLGQGKSTAMSLSLAKLSEKRKERAPEWIINWHDKLFGEPVVRFDVSHFKADDLEWRFLTAVLNQRTTHTLIWCWLPPFLIMLGFLTVLACWQTDLYDSSALEQVGTALLSLFGVRRRSKVLDEVPVPDRPRGTRAQTAIARVRPVRFPSGLVVSPDGPVHRNLTPGGHRRRPRPGQG